MNTTPHAGHYIKEWLSSNRLTQAELAVALNFKEPFISKIVNGKAHVSPKIAIKLEAVTNIPASLWMLYETEYMISRESRSQVQ